MFQSEPVWFRKPADLVGFFGQTPVSKQLDAYLDRFPRRRVEATDLAYVDGPLKKFLLPVMYPKRRLVPPHWSVSGRWNVDRDGRAKEVALPDTAPYASQLHELMRSEADGLVQRPCSGFTPTDALWRGQVKLTRPL